ncbi:hypothetical protein RD792_002874 [Penstemon davidsonii]|uniref:phosphopyruvate hydratase n=1 Tax=Penstemon davidsonii TaxID=160366 RepID=A0ABR0DS71_9LAMI|nr:hypothetical protein RD792_002874 [Penstemon davidsonii]
MSVQEYLDKHMLSRKIEDAVNAAVRAKTPDPVLFISNHMKKSVPSVITKVKARQILDSKGIPTVEVDLHTNKGVFRASAPSGASSGMYEAIELRDGDKGTYLGNGVSKAVNNINDKISEALIGMDPTLQVQIDQAMIDLDKTEKKGELGANAILAVSMAACKAGAAEKEACTSINHAMQQLLFRDNEICFLLCLDVHLQVPLYKHIADLAGKTSYNLPVPAFTVISGGKHAGNNLAIQVSLKEALDFVKEAIDRTGYNEKIKIGIDIAATEFCIGTKYDLDYKSPNKSGQNFKSGEDMIDMYKEICEAYPIVSIEDPFDKEDWEHTKYFTSLGICQVVGDDLLMSNHKRIERAAQDSACNALLLKVNQVGTVTEAIEAAKLAKDANWGVIISHRSGETEDSFIADLSVGLATGQIKAGAPCRGERLAKYNQAIHEVIAYLTGFVIPFSLRCCSELRKNLGINHFLRVMTGDTAEYLFVGIVFSGEKVSNA